MKSLADTLTTQLDNLRRERERLEHLLMLDGNWRALKQLEAREAAGEAMVAVDAVQLKASLLQALSTNRIYAARAKLIESIELLSGENGQGIPVVAVPIANRIVLLDAKVGEGFRWRVRLKEKPAAVPDAEAELPVPDAGTAGVVTAEKQDAPRKAVLPDALELIDGLGRPAVELLIEGGVTRYEELAGWTSGDVERWRERLAGVAVGEAGAWIEQAAILSQGRRTRYSVRARAGEFAALVPFPDALPARREIVRQMVEAEAPRLLSAEELIRSLIAAPGSDPIPAAPAMESKRGPYARPQVRDPDYRATVATAVPLPDRRPATTPIPDPEGDEVVVLRRDAPRSPGDAGFTTAARPRPQKLLRRLKQAVSPDRFEAEAYAAYRGLTEEASVTIVRSQAPPPKPVRAEPDPPVPPTGHSRFLKALTGHRSR